MDILKRYRKAPHQHPLFSLYRALTFIRSDGTDLEGEGGESSGSSEDDRAGHGGSTTLNDGGRGLGGLGNGAVGGRDGDAARGNGGNDNSAGGAGNVDGLVDGGRDDGGDVGDDGLDRVGRAGGGDGGETAGGVGSTRDLDGSSAVAVDGGRDADGGDNGDDGAGDDGALSGALGHSGTARGDGNVGGRVDGAIGGLVGIHGGSQDNSGSGETHFDGCVLGFLKKGFVRTRWVVESRKSVVS